MKTTISKEENMSTQSGFTLIEVIVAMAILSIGILASIGLQYQVVRGNAESNIVSEEMFLAQRIMERMKNVKQPSSLASSTLPAVNSAGDVPGPYKVVTVVTNPFGGGEARLITVAVSKIGGFVGHPVTLRSLTFGGGV
jgi:prepilin-type N-terminal cleavage/methylation domain-containing protein